MPDEEKRSRETEIMGQAYQVIAQIALTADLFENKEVQRALNYFSANQYREDFLPFPSKPMKRSTAQRPDTEDH